MAYWSSLPSTSLSYIPLESFQTRWQTIMATSTLPRIILETIIDVLLPLNRATAGSRELDYRQLQLRSQPLRNRGRGVSLYLQLDHKAARLRCRVSVSLMSSPTLLVRSYATCDYVLPMTPNPTGASSNHTAGSTVPAVGIRLTPGGHRPASIGVPGVSRFSQAVGQNTELHEGLAEHDEVNLQGLPTSMAREVQEEPSSAMPARNVSDNTF